MPSGHFRKCPDEMKWRVEIGVGVDSQTASRDEVTATEVTHLPPVTKLISLQTADLGFATHAYDTANGIVAVNGGGAVVGDSPSPQPFGTSVFTTAANRV